MKTYPIKSTTVVITGASSGFGDMNLPLFPLSLTNTSSRDYHGFFETLMFFLPEDHALLFILEIGTAWED
jgi:hypothetical protein